jgi:diaminopimelate epimerase
MWTPRPWLTQGPLVQQSPRFPARGERGFHAGANRSQIRLRVFERGAGETLACGTGACAAVVAGIRLGLLDAALTVHTRGGLLTLPGPGPTPTRPRC